MLEAIFNPDNKLFCAINQILDLMLLSLIWLLCCIPIVTIGPACTALYYAVVKSVRRQRSYPVREFWNAFRTNMKKGILLNLALIILSIMMLVTDVPFVLTLINTGKVEDTMLLLLFALKAFCLLGLMCWSYPLLSRFEENLIKLAESALFLLIRYFLVTLSCIFILLIAALLLWWEPLFFVFIPGIACLLISFLIEPVLRKLCEEIPESKTTGNVQDRWYLER